MRRQQKTPSGFTHEGVGAYYTNDPRHGSRLNRDGSGTRRNAGCPNSHRAISLVFVCIPEYQRRFNFLDKS